MSGDVKSNTQPHLDAAKQAGQKIASKISTDDFDPDEFTGGIPGSGGHQKPRRPTEIS